MNNRGIVLMISVVLVLAISIFCLALVSMAYMNRTEANHYKKRVKSFYAADGVITFIAQECINGNGKNYKKGGVGGFLNLGTLPWVSTDTVNGWLSGKIYPAQNSSATYPSQSNLSNLSLTIGYTSYKTSSNGKEIQFLGGTTYNSGLGMIALKDNDYGYCSNLDSAAKTVYCLKGLGYKRLKCAVGLSDFVGRADGGGVPGSNKNVSKGYDTARGFYGIENYSVQFSVYNVGRNHIDWCRVPLYSSSTNHPNGMMHGMTDTCDIDITGYDTLTLAVWNIGNNYPDTADFADWCQMSASSGDTPILGEFKISYSVADSFTISTKAIDSLWLKSGKVSFTTSLSQSINSSIPTSGPLLIRDVPQYDNVPQTGWPITCNTTDSLYLVDYKYNGTTSRKDTLIAPAAVNLTDFPNEYHTHDYTNTNFNYDMNSGDTVYFRYFDENYFHVNNGTIMNSYSGPNRCVCYTNCWPYPNIPPDSCYDNQSGCPDNVPKWHFFDRFRTSASGCDANSFVNTASTVHAYKRYCVAGYVKINGINTDTVELGFSNPEGGHFNDYRVIVIRVYGVRLITSGKDTTTRNGIAGSYNYVDTVYRKDLVMPSCGLYIDNLTADTLFLGAILIRDKSMGGTWTTINSRQNWFRDYGDLKN
jgi:hypothetical protein